MRSEERGARLTGQNARQDLMNCPCAKLGGTALVVLQQPTKRFMADHVFQAEIVDWLGWRQRGVDPHVAETLMGV